MLSATERNPIGRRTESDRTADAIRLDGERCFKGVHLSPLGFAACQSKKCTNKAILKGKRNHTTPTSCKGNSLIIRLLPLQGECRCGV